MPTVCSCKQKSTQLVRLSVVHGSVKEPKQNYRPEPDQWRSLPDDDKCMHDCRQASLCRFICLGSPH